MVEAEEPGLNQQHFPQVSLKVDCMVAPFEPKKPEFLSANADVFRVPPNVVQDGQIFSDFIGRVPTVEALGLFAWPAIGSQAAFLSPSPPPTVKQILLPSELYEKPSPREASFPQPKRYLIFDQSRDKTRLILSSLHPPGLAPIAAAALRKPTHVSEIPRESDGVKVERNSLQMRAMLERSDADHMVESYTHEDTQEIDALLYSDDEDEVNCKEEEDDNDDEEVSTGHSPLAVKKENDKKHEHREDDGEEVDSSECSPKRRKTLVGGCCKPTPIHTSNVASPLEHYADDIDAEFSSSLGGAETDPGVGNKRPRRKGKVHDMVTILQRIIPGAEGKEPLLVLDDAIKYLKHLKSIYTES